jgi:hypothetical protein
VLKYVFIGLAVGIAFLLIAIQQAGAAA